MIPSRVLSITTCTFILLLVLNVDVAVTVTPTPGSYSTNIDYATTSPDKNCILAYAQRFGILGARKKLFHTPAHQIAIQNPTKQKKKLQIFFLAEMIIELYRTNK